MDPLGALTLQHSFESESVEATLGLGRALGTLLEPGDFIGLSGKLGMGKTVLVRGVAEGADVSTDQVASPTFAIVYPYEGRIPLYHADFYRLHDVKELHAIGFFEMGEDGARLVEWAERIPEALPADRLQIQVEEQSERERLLRAEARGTRSCALLRAWMREARGS